jgi:hypothetical protein
VKFNHLPFKVYTASLGSENNEQAIGAELEELKVKKKTNKITRKNKGI